MRARSFGDLTRALAVALSAPALFGLAACAAAREPAPEASAPQAAGAETMAPTIAAGAAGATDAQPTYDQPRAATSVDQALADLQRAEGELGLAFQALGGGPARKSTAQGPAPDSTIPPGRAEAPATAPRSAAEAELTSDPCLSACRALASMTRATTHLCDLTGDADQRCDNARTRLRSARERVEGSCACGPPG